MTNQARAFQDGIKGRVTTPGVGEVGESYNGSRSVTCTTAGAWYANTNPIATLTPGIWLISIQLRPPAATATANTLLGFVSSDSDNAATGILIPQLGIYSFAATTLSQQGTTQSVRVVTITTSSMLYAKCYSEDVAGAVVSTFVEAVRIA